MKDRVKVGLVGCGSLSQRGILPHLVLDDAREIIDLVAVCDVVEERARSVAEKFNVPNWYADYQALLAQADLDAVLLITPIAFHCDQALDAIAAGKHVYLQKTMTTTLAEADRLIDAARREGVKLVASPGQMLSPANQHIKRLVREGALGRVYWAFSNTFFVGHEYEPFRAENPVNPTWYYKKPGGGPMYDMAAYVLHSLTGILGPARRVSAMSGIGLPNREWQGAKIEVEMDDNTLLLLDFGDNCFAMIGGQFCQMGRVINWGFTGIYGSQAAVEITGRHGSTPLPAEITVNPPGMAEALGVADPAFSLEAVPYISGEHAKMPEMHVWADIHHFADCVLNDKEPVVSGEHARHVIEIIEKGYVAAETGHAQKLRTTF